MHFPWPYRVARRALELVYPAGTRRANSPLRSDAHTLGILDETEYTLAVDIAAMTFCACKRGGVHIRATSLYSIPMVFHDHDYHAENKGQKNGNNREHAAVI